MFDEGKAEFNTTVNFSIYGGKDCWSGAPELIFDQAAIVKTDICLLQNHLGLILNSIRSGIVLALLIPLKGKALRNLGGAFLRSLPKGISGTTREFI